jgi:1-acyl-sn-glycerol-3-phosphate acyltransferase
MEPQLPLDESPVEPIDMPPPTVANRLRFLWMVFAMFCIAAPLVVCQFVTHRRDPSARNFKRWAGRWGRWTLRAGGIRIHVKDEAGLDPSRPYVFASNHQNALDILALVGGVPYPFGFVAKSELRKMPLIGTALKNSASLFIDRSDPRLSLQSLQEAGARIREGNSVLIYPEGARSFGPRLLPLKRGAFMVALEAGVPVVPVTIIDAYRLLDERGKLARPGTIHIRLGKPIEVSGLHRRDLPVVMDAVLEQMDAPLEVHRRAYRP